MTIQNIYQPTRYVANGTDVDFDFDFNCPSSDELQVTVDGVLTVNYNATGFGQDAGGTITFASPPASGANVVLYKVTDILQQTNYINTVPPETVESDLDHGIQVDQELADGVSRSIHFPEGAWSMGTVELPASPSMREDKILGFDSSGQLAILEAGNVPVTTLDAQAVGNLLYGERGWESGIQIEDKRYKPGRVMRYIPQAQHAAILDARNSTFDTAAVLRPVIDALSAAGGGELIWEEGQYAQADMHRLKNNVRCYGQGYATHLFNTNGTSDNILSTIFNMGSYGATSVFNDMDFYDLTWASSQKDNDALICVTAAEAGNFTVGDVVLVGSRIGTGTIENGMPEVPKYAQLAEVVEVNATTGLVRLARPIYNDIDGSVDGDLKIGRMMGNAAGGGTLTDGKGLIRYSCKRAIVDGFRMTTGLDGTICNRGSMYECEIRNLWIDAWQGITVNAQAHSLIENIKGTCERRHYEQALYSHHDIVRNWDTSFKDRGSSIDQDQVPLGVFGAHHLIDGFKCNIGPSGEGTLPGGVNLNNVINSELRHLEITGQQMDFSLNLSSNYEDWGDGRNTRTGCVDNLIHDFWIRAPQATRGVQINETGGNDTARGNVIRNGRIECGASAGDVIINQGRNHIENIEVLHDAITGNHVEAKNGATVRDIYFRSAGSTHLSYDVDDESVAENIVSPTARTLRAWRKTEYFPSDNSTVKTAIKTISIPADTLQQGDRITLRIAGRRLGATGAANVAIDVGSDTPLTLTKAVTGTQDFEIEVEVYARTAAIVDTVITVRDPSETANDDCSYNVGSDDYTAAPVDIVLSSWVANAADSVLFPQIRTDVYRQYEVE